MAPTKKKLKQAQSASGSSPRPQASSSASILLVPDTLAALQALAAAYRDYLARCNCRVIGVVGSNGKTTTRNLIHTVLSARYPGTQSPKSFNNHIGVPLTLLAAEVPSAARSPQSSAVGAAQPAGVPIMAAVPGALGPSIPVAPALAMPPTLDPSTPASFVVVEIGTNHPGEIDALGRIVRPDAVVVTSIGHEHMEFFKTLDGVATEESAILPHVKPAGVAFIESGAMAAFDRLKLLPASLRTFVYGNDHPDSVLAIYDPPRIDPRIDPRSGDSQVFSTRGGKLQVRLPILGHHNAINALGAIAVGRWMGMDDAAIVAALAGAKPVEMRMNVLRLGASRPDGGITVINDAYNANPSSVMAAIATLAQMPLGRTESPAPRRVVVLGDMLELGEAGPDLHRQVGRVIALGPAGMSDAAMPPATIAPPRIHEAIFIGRLAMFMAETLARHWPAERIHAFAAWDDALPARVAGLLRAGDTVLVKASRGSGLERLMPEIHKKFG